LLLGWLASGRPDHPAPDQPASPTEVQAGQKREQH